MSLWIFPVAQPSVPELRRVARPIVWGSLIRFETIFRAASMCDNLDMSDIDEAEARRIMAGGLGRAELEIVTSFAAPLYWILEENDRLRVRNGTTFFLNAGEGVFGVTAAHVLDELQEHLAAGRVRSAQIGRDHLLDLNGAHAIIASQSELDIATFRFSASEVAAIGKTILTGSQTAWPPVPPMVDRGVTFVGYPGHETQWLTRSEISFGAAPGGGVATSVSELDVSTQLQRENWIDVLGLGFPAEQYNFGGISGGPMLSVIERHGVRSWALAGVIYQGPNPSDDPEEAIAGFEVIRARRAHFILPDGTLDLARWATIRA